MNVNRALYDAMPVTIQNALVSGYGYYLKRKRHPSRELRTLVAESRSWTTGDIERYHALQLRSIIRHCASVVPYYRQLFSSIDSDVTAFRDVRDLKRLPLLSKQTVRTNADAFLTPAARPYWTQHTSGSTGTPVVVHVNDRTYHLVHALLEQHEADCGIAPRDLRATFAGRMVQPSERLEPPFWRYNFAQHQILFSAYHLSEQTLPHYVAELARRQPAELIGYPSAIAAVATHIIGSGTEGSIRPRVVITNSETLFQWQRQAIERAFSCPVRDYYGSAEALVFAAQCPAGAYHFDPLLGIAEVVDVDGREVAPGQMGRLVCTTLTNTVMPLIRYEIGDCAMALNGPCSCGSAFLGVREIVGREDDTITTRDGRAVGRIDHIFKGVLGIQECQVVQEAYDVIRLLIVADEGFTPRQEQLLRQNLHERLGSTIRVDISHVQQIPRSRAGKFRGVLSRVTSGQPLQ